MKIVIHLSENNWRGLQALDKRRSLGLPDGEMLTVTTHSYQHSAVAPESEVSEGFARLWFDTDQTVSDVTIPATSLTAEDVQLLDNGYTATFRSDLSAERIRELYVAGRFRACREQVERLTRERDELRYDAEAAE